MQEQTSIPTTRQQNLLHDFQYHRVEQERRQLEQQLLQRDREFQELRQQLRPERQ